LLIYDEERRRERDELVGISRATAYFRWGGTNLSSQEWSAWLKRQMWVVGDRERTVSF
jgi:hypothetical protein